MQKCLLPRHNIMFRRPVNYISIKELLAQRSYADGIVDVEIRKAPIE